MRYRILDTPTGLFAVMRDDDGGLTTTWVDNPADPRLAGGTPDGTDASLSAAADKLTAYFAGRLVDFSSIPTPRGESFFARCWDACRTIPRGETRRYAELAIMAGGEPGAARAAGQAMRRNPLPIIIPCHRVVAAGDRLGGFSGSADPDSRPLAVKRWLLRMEGVMEGVMEGAIAEDVTLFTPPSSEQRAPALA